MINKQQTDDVQRKYPRKPFRKPVAFLCHGVSHIVSGFEIGEGGLSFEYEEQMSLEQNIVINFFVPGGSFFSLKATTKNRSAENSGKKIYGVSFDEVSLAMKREIRAYVSLAAVKNDKKI